MRALILSDIHGNLPALHAALADAERLGPIDEVWCLGDTLGYGAQPRECLAWVRERATVLLSGNHDLGAVGTIGLEWFNAAAAAACRWSGAQLTQEERDFVAALPPQMERPPFTLVHGSPLDPVYEYVVSADAAQAALERCATPHCLVGHSHLPLLYRHPIGGSPGVLEPLLADSPIPLGRDRLLINPGSVGQPRDNDPRAAYAVYDDAANTLLHRRVPYDIAEAQRLILAAGLPRRLAERLSHGW